MALLLLLALLAAGAGALYWSFTRNFDYWKKRNVHYLQPTVFFGNIKDAVLLKKSSNFVFQDLYNQLEGHKYAGVFQMTNPTLLIRDPEMIKAVMVKDFAHFQDRGMPADPKRDPLSQHLFRLEGAQWRHLRTKLSPTFTSGKIRTMFQVMEECSRRLQQCLARPAARGDVMEMKDVVAKFSTDVIGTCAFGLQMNALENPHSEFRLMGRKVLAQTPGKAIKRKLEALLPRIFKLLKITSRDPAVTEFFLRVVEQTIDYREKNNIVRNDFLQLLIELKNKGKVDDEDHEKDVGDGVSRDKDSKPVEEIEMGVSLLAAQAFVFFIAGFETSSTTVSFALHELAVNPELQAKLREEIDAALASDGGRFTYDAVTGMKYLDKVVSETLRKYPPVGQLIRAVAAPCALPGAAVRLDKGVKVVIPVYALHHDPKYFPDPERFDPERFSEEQRARRPHHVYLPFGEGPRNCIGMRFGLLQTKLALAALVSKYEFHVCARTEIPLRIDPKSIVTTSVTGTILRVTDRRGAH